MIGISNSGAGIGDKLQFSSFPENWFLEKNEKIIDLENCWIFDHNPFVARGEKPSQKFDLWFESANLNQKQRQGKIKHKLLGMPHRICAHFDIPCKVRRPRLYLYEDVIPDPKCVTVHAVGKSEGGKISKETADYIDKNYGHCKIFQVGGKDDPKLSKNWIDCLGMGMWETAHTIASCGTFIGVNSGLSHVANCYPKVRKKIIVNQYSKEQLVNWIPTQYPEWTAWIDFGWEYYNVYDYDIGATYSHKLI